MCGRYALPDPEDIPIRFKGTRPIGYGVKPRYNAAPSENMPVVVSDGEKHIELMRWGLVPFWAKDEKIGYKMINARAEMLSEKPSFRKALSMQRCIVPAGGFFEWKHEGKEKTPYYIHLKHQKLFDFAGLYDRWRNKDGKELHSYTIITTRPNAVVGAIHDRMPVILTKDHEETWLNPDETDPSRLLHLLQPYSNEDMEAYPVSRLVNSPAYDSKEVIEPATNAG
jgi:putative SOS response-associated peptidase YedK